MARITSVPCDGETTTYVSPPKLRVARALARLPRLGDTVGLMLDPTFYLFEKYLRHGPVFTVKMPYQTYTVLAGSEAATFMSSKDGRECLTVGSSWRFVEEQFGGKDSLVAVDGPQHKQWRTLLQRGYSREAIADRYSEAIDVIDDAVDKHWRPGESVPVLPAMQKLSIAQVGTFLGGVRPTDDDIEDIALVTREILKIAPVQHIPKFMLQLPRYVNARSRVARVAQNALALAGHSSASGRRGQSTLLEDILESCRDDPNAANQRNMLFHSVLPYFAGVETTSATATYALYLILRHPDVLCRIQTRSPSCSNGAVSPTTACSTPLPYCTARSWKQCAFGLSHHSSFVLRQKISSSMVIRSAAAKAYSSAPPSRTFSASSTKIP